MDCTINERRSERTILSTSKKNQNQTSSSSDPNIITNHRDILELILNILEQVQDAGRIKSKSLVTAMVDTRKKCDVKSFPRILFRALVSAFSSSESNNEYIEKIFHFVFETTIEIHQLESKEIDDGGSEPDETFLEAILRSCTKYNSDYRIPVRCNITRLCAKLLDSVSLSENISEKTSEKIKEMISHRIRDKSTRVRMFAVSALQQFQSVENFNSCKITKVLMQRLKYDSSFEVRKAALKALNVNDRTLDCVVERVTDVNESVRMTAFYNIAKKVSMDQVAVDWREKILEVGLSDNSTTRVRKRADMVVDKWLSSCNNDVVTFLSKLDVITKKKKICCLALDSIFRKPTSKYFEKVNRSYWDENKLIPYENLSEEVAFYWKYILKRFAQIAVYAELLLPTVHNLCQYLLTYMKDYETKYKGSHDPSILGELLEVLAISTKLSEEGGKLEILQFIHSAFNFENLVVPHIKELMCILQSFGQQTADAKFFEIVDDMLEPFRKLSQETNNTEEPTPSMATLSDDDLMDMRLEMADIIHKRHKLIKVKDEAVLANDFLKAHELQLKIDEFQGKVEAIRLKINKSQELFRSQEKSDSQQNAEQITEANENELDLRHCPDSVLEPIFIGFHELIRKQFTISSSAHTFYDMHLTAAILSGSALVREYVIKSLTIFGLRNINDAFLTMQFCLQGFQNDVGSIKRVAYRCMFDLVSLYGFETFESDTIQQTVASKMRIADISESLADDRKPSLTNLMIQQLNSEDPYLVKIGVFGITRLFLADRISSRKCVTKLLLMWNNPTYEGSEIGEVISKWLPLLAKRGLQHSLLIANSVIPTVRTILNAGHKSPLVEANPEKLFAFVSSATNPMDLELYLKNPEAAHEKIANDILDEMLNLGHNAESLIYGKALKFVNIHGGNGKSLRILLKKTTRLIKMQSHKGLSQSLSAFKKYLNSEILMADDKQTEVRQSQDLNDSSESESEENVHISDSSSVGEPSISEDDENTANEDRMNETTFV